MADIRVEQLSRSFDGIRAVKDISFDIADGEFVFFLGPSGCGKTTTLRMIAGLLMPSGGRVAIGGRDVTYLRPRDRNVGMVFQANVLYHHLSVLENLAYPLRARGVARAEIGRKVREVARLLQIEDVLARSTDRLSAGQAQRVAIGRMLVREANVFLMDEPISHLDAKLRAHMRAELRHLQKELGQTTLFVTHDQLEAMSMADRIMVMSDGAIQQLAPPQQVFDRPANEFVAGFVGEPHMNILPVTLDGTAARGADFLAELSPTTLPRDLPRALRLGVRPEHVDLLAEPGPGSFPAAIVAAEPIGAESLFSFELGGIDFKARTPAEATDHLLGAVGHRVHLRPRPDHIYLFDAATGRTLAQAGFTHDGNEA
jgi:multiple sugar transport system ATP-binding protein